MNLKERLTSVPWTVNDGAGNKKTLLYFDERYFVLDEDASVFDGGAIAYDEARNTIALRNEQAFGELVLQRETPEGLYLAGTLYSALAGAIEIEFDMSPGEGAPQWPPTDSIFQAALHGDVTALQGYLDAGEDVNAANERGNTPLMFAAAQGSLYAVSLLLQAGADVRRLNQEGQSVLHDAIAADSVPIIALLLAHGVRPDNAASENNSLFHAARADASPEVFERLLASGADINADPGPLLERAMFHSKYGPFDARENVELIALLIDRGIALDRPGHHRERSAVLYAAANGFVRVLGLLIEAGGDVRAVDENAHTALNLICTDYHQGEAELESTIRHMLIEAGAGDGAPADVVSEPEPEMPDEAEARPQDAQDEAPERATPFDEAQAVRPSPLEEHFSSRFPLELELTDKGLDVQAHMMNNPWVAEIGDEEKLLFLEDRYFIFDADGSLLAHGAIFYDTAQKRITLFSSRMRGELFVADSYVDDLHLFGKWRFTATGNAFNVDIDLVPLEEALERPKPGSLHEAAAYGDFMAVMELLGAGADANALDDEGNTALMCALQEASVGVAGYLIGTTSALDTRNRNGDSALDIAIKTGREELLGLVLAQGVAPDNEEAGHNTLALAGLSGAPLSAFALLVAHGARVDIPSGIILDHVMRGNVHDIPRGIEILAYLIDAGAGVNEFFVAQGGALTPAMQAARYGMADFLAFLVERGADTGIENPRGETAADLICQACVETDTEVEARLRELLGARAGSASAAPSTGVTDEELEALEHMARLHQARELVPRLDELEGRLPLADHARLLYAVLHDTSQEAPEVYERALAVLEGALLNEVLAFKDYIEQSLTLIDRWIAALPRNEDYEVDDEGPKLKALALIEQYLARGEFEEDVLAGYKRKCEDYAQRLRMGSEEATPVTQAAHQCVLNALDKLMAFDEEHYVYDKLRFLSSFERRWVDEHFRMHNRLLELDEKYYGDDQARRLAQYVYDDMSGRHGDPEDKSTCQAPIKEFLHALDLYERRADHENALWYYERILEAQPVDKATWRRLLLAELEAGGLEAALRVFDKAIESATDDAHWIKEKTQFQCRHGLADAALSENLGRIDENPLWRQTLLPLIECGADLGTQYGMGNTAFIEVSEYLSLQQLEYVGKKYVPDIDQVNYEGNSAFMVWAGIVTDKLKVPAILEVLARLGANPNKLNEKTGRNALFRCARKGELERIELLIKHFGVDPTLRDHEGRSVLDVAADEQALVQLLESLGVDMSFRERAYNW